MFKLVLAVSSLVFVGTANAQSFQNIENCRQLVDAADRVACYDALKPADAPQPKIEPAAAPPHVEQACEMLALAARLSNLSNCQEGDIARITGISTRDLSEILATQCDFGSQIVTLPDTTSLASIGGDPTYVVVCKLHQRKTAPRK